MAANTVIEDRILEVDKDETSSSITIRATSVKNNKISGIYTIPVTEAIRSTIKKINVSVDPVHRGTSATFTATVEWDPSAPEGILDTNAVYWRVVSNQGITGDAMDRDTGALKVPDTFDWNNKAKVEVTSQHITDWKECTVEILEPIVEGVMITPNSAAGINRGSMKPSYPRATRDFTVTVSGKGNPHHNYYNYGAAGITVSGESGKSINSRTSVSLKETNKIELTTTPFERNNKLTVTANVGGTISATASVTLTGTVWDGDWYMVSVGGDHSMAIDYEGALFTWGRNQFGQLGNNAGNSTTADEKHNTNKPEKIGAYTDWVYITGGQEHSLALRESGELYAWGNQSNGRLGNNVNNGFQNNPGTAIAGTWKTSYGSISAGISHSLGIQQDGTLWAWGDGGNGRLGLGNNNSHSTPQQVKLYDSGTALPDDEQPGWSKVSAGGTHSAAITTSGDLYVWGDNGKLQVGIASGATNRPVQIKDDTKWKDVVAAWDFTVAITVDGKLFVWGNNDYGQLGETVSSSTNTHLPKESVAGKDIEWESASMASGSNHFAGIAKDGRLFVFGRNQWGQLGNGKDAGGTADNSANEHTLQQIKVVPAGDREGDKWTSVQAGSSFMLAIAEGDQSLWVWGDNRFGQLGNGEPLKQELEDQSSTNVSGIPGYHKNRPLQVRRQQ